MSGIYIAIDPGQIESGYIVIDRSWGKISFKEFGIISNDDIFSLFEKYSINNPEVVIEMINPMGMRIGQSTIATIFWIGRFFEKAKNLNCKPTLIERQIVKKTICPKIKSNDSIIRATMIKRYGEQGTKKNPGPTYNIKSHIWQALAVLTTHFIREGIIT